MLPMKATLKSIFASMDFDGDGRLECSEVILAIQEVF
jgi:hypothetical protein